MDIKQITPEIVAKMPTEIKDVYDLLLNNWIDFVEPEMKEELDIMVSQIETWFKSLKITKTIEEQPNTFYESLTDREKHIYQIIIKNRLNGGDGRSNSQILAEEKLTNYELYPMIIKMKAHKIIPAIHKGKKSSGRPKK